MLTWKKTIVTSVIIGATLYGGLSYARIIPGVDEPFDPANYWSLTSVSWPDSAPSIYTLRDMGIYINQTTFINDFWNESIIADFAKNAQGYYDFLDSLYDSEGSYSGPSFDDSRYITVDDKGTQVNYDLYKYYLMGGHQNEYVYMGRKLNWQTNDAYGMMNYIIDQFDKDPTKYTRYLVQSGPSNVYDPWREKEQKENNKQTESWLQNAILSTLHKVLQMTPWDKNITRTVENGITDLYQMNKTNSASMTKDAQNDPKLFANTKDPLSPDSNGKSPYANDREKILYMKDRLDETAKFLDNLTEDEKKTNELIQYALEMSANATSVVEVEQARNILEGVKAAQFSKRNRIISEMNNLDVLQQMQQMDEYVKSQQINKANKLYTYDPMNPTKIDEDSYKRPEPMGMLSFK